MDFRETRIHLSTRYECDVDFSAFGNGGESKRGKKMKIHFFITLISGFFFLSFLGVYGLY